MLPSVWRVPSNHTLLPITLAKTMQVQDRRGEFLKPSWQHLTVWWANLSISQLLLVAHTKDAIRFDFSHSLECEGKW
jgi:hypothetical protein